MMILVLVSLPLRNPGAAVRDVGPNPSEKVLKQIVKNHPAIEKKYAAELAKIIVAKTAKYNVSPRIMTAIIMQESAYKLNAKQCYNIKGRPHCDYCMVQINDQTIKRYGFDQKLLMTSLSYCIEAGVRVLSDFRKAYQHRDKEYWTRFNANDPVKRIAYRDRVTRYL